VVAQDAVELGAEAFDGAAALGVQVMGAEFDADAVDVLEGMSEEEVFALGVEAGALDGCRVPGRADLDAAVGGVDVRWRRCSCRWSCPPRDWRPGR
jgi:hypothetical protein